MELNINYNRAVTNASIMVIFLQNFYRITICYYKSFFSSLKSLNE